MFSIFFIRRPVFAGVISIVTVLLGLIAMVALPIARYPEISPPTISVTAVYPGADAETVAETVAAPLEQEINGVEGMLYLSSVSSNNGLMSMTITFEIGTDLDIANVLVQNRVAVAESSLPEEVLRQGVVVKKRSTDTAAYMAVHSPDNRYDDLFLSNFAALRLKDELSRVPGVSEVQSFGAGDYSIRLWLDPDRLAFLGLDATDVIQAVREQSAQIPGGSIGKPPLKEPVPFEYTVKMRGRLSEVAEFENIVIRTESNGSVLRLKDVARVEIGASTYDYFGRFNGLPCALLSINQIPGSNLIEVVNGIREKLDELSATFPEGLEVDVVYDATDIVKASLNEVVVTLFITLILVVLTVYLFLQDFRATLVPAVTIPVSLIGTFFVMPLIGLDINQFTLFALVLVIGIVVDDAIVVVENTSRHIADGLKPRAAAEKAMIEVSGPVIATTLVLLAVFIPSAFMGGITGRLFVQFALTISVATVFSSINALTLSPALCAILLRKSDLKTKGPLGGFNRAMDWLTVRYGKVVAVALRRSLIGVTAFIAMTIAAGWGFTRLPTSFVPQEDEGYNLVSLQLPDGASLARTREAIAKIEPFYKGQEGIENAVFIAGYSILDGAPASNAAFGIITYNDWSERPETRIQQPALLARQNRFLYGQNDMIAFALAPPSLPGVGVNSGLTLQIQDRGGVGLAALMATVNGILGDANSQSGLSGFMTTFRASIPQLFVDINREQVKALGIPLNSVFGALQTYLGSAYVNDVVLFGRIFQVTAQAEADARARPGDILKLKVKNRQGEMTPLGSVVEVRETLGPMIISRFNVYPSIKILGNAAPGFSSGQAMAITEDMLDRTLPPTIGYAWDGLSFQEKAASGGMVFIFGFAVVLVFLVLAAQYESWSLPISVCLAVPTALLGAVVGMFLRDMDNNVYTQVGIVLLIGLSAKSAILIVEFAKQLHDEGRAVREAALEAARLRLRPVLMTAFSFILGVIPLIVASGAGAESRKVLGTAVFFGMLFATVISLIAVPMLFAVVQSTFGKKAAPDGEERGTGSADTPPS